MARSGPVRRQGPVRSGRMGTARRRASRKMGWSRPGSTSGWWRCQRRGRAGCCRWMSIDADQAPGPVVALDSGYDPVQVARAELASDVLVRLRSNRVFYRAPGPYQGRGAPRKYGDVFRLADPATHGTPDASSTLADPQC